MVQNNTAILTAKDKSLSFVPYAGYGQHFDLRAAAVPKFEGQNMSMSLGIIKTRFLDVILRQDRRQVIVKKDNREVVLAEKCT